MPLRGEYADYNRFLTAVDALTGGRKRWPSRQEFKSVGLLTALEHYGPQRVRKDLGLMQENIDQERLGELLKIAKGGVMPSKPELEHIGRGDLVLLIASQGGFKQVASRLGLEWRNILKKEKAAPSEEEVHDAIRKGEILADSNEHLAYLHQQGDRDALGRLIAKNLKFANSLSRRFFGADLEVVKKRHYGDLVSVNTLAAFEDASRTYNHKKGMKFIGWLSLRLRSKYGWILTTKVKQAPLALDKKMGSEEQSRTLLDFIGREDEAPKTGVLARVLEFFGDSHRLTPNQLKILEDLEQLKPVDVARKHAISRQAVSCMLKQVTKKLALRRQQIDFYKQKCLREQRLSDAEREILRMRFLEGKSKKEIAKTLSTNYDRVRHQIEAALQRIKLKH